MHLFGSERECRLKRACHQEGHDRPHRQRSTERDTTHASFWTASPITVEWAKKEGRDYVPQLDPIPQVWSFHWSAPLLFLLLRSEVDRISLRTNSRGWRRKGQEETGGRKGGSHSSPLRIDRHLPCCLSTAEDTFLQMNDEAGIYRDEHGTKQCIYSSWGSYWWCRMMTSLLITNWLKIVFVNLRPYQVWSAAKYHFPRCTPTDMSNF